MYREDDFLKKRAVSPRMNYATSLEGRLNYSLFSLPVAVASVSNVHSISIGANHYALSQVGYFYPLGYLLHTAAQ